MCLVDDSSIQIFLLVLQTMRQLAPHSFGGNRHSGNNKPKSALRGKPNLFFCLGRNRVYSIRHPPDCQKRTMLNCFEIEVLRLFLREKRRGTAQLCANRRPLRQHCVLRNMMAWPPSERNFLTSQMLSQSSSIAERIFARFAPAVGWIIMEASARCSN